MRTVGTGGRTEGAPYGVGELMHEKPVGETAVRELGLAQRQPDAVHRVVGEPAGLLERGARGGERVPGAGGGVRLPVLHRVQQMREPPEEAPGLGERCGVVRPSGEHGGVREGRRGRRLGRLGDRQDRGAGSGQRLVITFVRV